MRDFYDLHALSNASDILPNEAELQEALLATMDNRNSMALLPQASDIMEAIASSEHM